MNKQKQQLSSRPVRVINNSTLRTGLLQRKAFTLVELIVVITILAILGTIAFISLQGYSATSRDSVRISDVSNMKTSLELFHLNAGKYPLPDDYGTLEYNSNTLFYQGTFGKNVVQSLSRNMTKAPLDPLMNREYIYSVSANKNELEILSLLEKGDVASNAISQTNAAGITVIPKISGNYNGLFIKTSTDIVPLPSIINTEVLPGEVLVLGTENIKSMVTHLGENIPTYGNVNSNTGKLLDLTLSVYNGTVNNDSNNDIKIAVYTAIASAYSGSSLEGNGIIKTFLSKTTNEERVAITETVVLNNTTAATTPTETVVNSCATTPAFTNIGTATEGTATSENQAWSFNETPGNCTYTCTTGWTGTNCSTYICPTGFIHVPGNATFSTTDFCVAKYEMSFPGLTQIDNNGGRNTYSYLDNSGTKPAIGSIVSAQGNSPIAEITQPQAIAECNAMGDGFHLITNNEWMTIARNIEAQDSNWSSGTVGNGYISNGISNDTTLGCIGNGSNHLPTANQYGTVTGANICGGKNKNMLSNGQEIWDFSGNVWEQVNKTNDKNDTDGVNGTMTEFTTTDNRIDWTHSLIDNVERLNYGSSVSVYNSTNGIGGVYDTGTTNNIIFRGGSAGNGSNTGIFALVLSRTSATQSSRVGFRCAK